MFAKTLHKDTFFRRLESIPHYASLRITHIQLYIKFLSPGEQVDEYGRRESYSTHRTRHGGHFIPLISDRRLAGGRKRDDWQPVPAAGLAGGRHTGGSEIKLVETLSYWGS